jgi:hypothetical protein
MSRENLVHRLIAFLKRPDALDHHNREPVRNAYDDYARREATAPRPPREPVQHAVETAPHPPEEALVDEPLVRGGSRSPGHASRLDALVMRAAQQFNARLGFVVRTDRDGRMRYCTGRTVHGRYIAHTDVEPNRRAIWMAWDSGESQLVMVQPGNRPGSAVLCGPLWDDGQIIGVLYLDGPARNHLHRGIFDVFCDQAARLLRDGAA